MKERAIIGCLLGTAAGDAMGLPYEGMSAARGRRIFPDTDRHHFLLGRGMVSDDTEHACFSARAVIASHGDPERFERSLAWSLRLWLLGLPAGVGFATLRSILLLWAGVPARMSGVRSAGNGPAMRSPVLGVAYGDSPEKLREFVLRSTRMTHTDQRAYLGSLVVAAAAWISSQGKVVAPHEFEQIVSNRLQGIADEDIAALILKTCRSAERGEDVHTFAEAIGSRKGISGYMYHTVPCVIQTWLRHQTDFRGGIREIIEAGGDTDTSAAILGGIIGAHVGKEGIPEHWLDRIIEWPRSVNWMDSLGEAVAKSLEDGAEVSVPKYFVPGIALRNLLFLTVVLGHGFRRMLPPY